ncbi:molybdopterin-dependent oxidoreductase [Proteiniborus sp.]|uniref:molybdopterin-containing oxidoreductase family protein n=1 Tax=Proteiniborus sp. TaxID=2079015 RepID=UPI003332008C
MYDNKKNSAYNIVCKKGTCGICNCFCGIQLLVKDNKIIEAKGDKEHPLTKGFICPKGRAIPEIVHSEERLRKPLKKNGQGAFEEISWEEALDIIVEKLRNVKKEFGPEALALHTGQAGVFMQFTSYAERFCQVYGTPNFSTAGSHCNTSKELANIVTVGSLPVPDYGNSKCILLWGYNPQYSAPAQMMYINKGLQNGAKLIVIDPKQTKLAKKADIHLRIRPGTDGALALGFIHLIIKNKLYDDKFVKKWTIGFDELIELAKDYSPERTSKITGISSEDIIEACKIFVQNKPANISPGISLELQSNGFQTARAISILQVITGNIDIIGGARLNKTIPLSPIVMDRKVHTGKPPIGGDKFPLFYKINGRAQANIFSDAILDGNPYPLKAMIVIGSNPILTWPNTNKLRKALEKIDFLVVMDIFMTETAKLADLIIPGVNYLERYEIWNGAIRFGEELMGLSPKIIDTTDGMSEWKFISEIAKGLGYIKEFPWSTEEEALDYRLEALGLTFEEIEKMSNGYEYGVYKEKRYELEGFKTPSKKAEIYSKTLEELGIEPLPKYYEPAESPKNTKALAKKYPLILSTGARNLEYYHSRFRNIESLRNFKKAFEPLLEINPKTAYEEDIEEGDTVIVESLRGSIELAARLTEDLPQGTIYIPHGWDEANANELTDNKELDPITGFPPDRTLLARITKVNK